jgi:glycosyltransferase involved in cell wall biosynthesis
MLRYAMRVVRAAMMFKPEVIIATHLALSPLGFLIRLFRGTPYLVAAHGAEAWGRLPLWKREPFLRADAILGVSELTLERVRRNATTDLDNLHLLPNAFNRRLLAVTEDDTRVNENVSLSDRVILTVGRLSDTERHKGQEAVLRALPEVLRSAPDAKYVIVGDGPYADHLEGVAGEAGVPDRVVILGGVTDEQLVALYRRCDVFVLPATTRLDGERPMGEGFGIVLLEAMAFGKAVIGPRDGAPAEFIEDGKQGLLVDPTDTHAIAAAIVEVLSSADRAEQMGMEGRRLVEGSFSIERFRDRLDSILDESLP